MTDTEPLALAYLYSTIASLEWKPKDILSTPWLLALALQADGWYLRQDIVWSKLNPMPESVTDRCTKAHEYVFLLSKSREYFYDADAIREPGVMAPGTNRGGSLSRFGPGEQLVAGHAHRGGAEYVSNGGRNKRSVWEIATQPYVGAHFATFPEALVEPCIKMGTSERGCCPECGTPWERRVTTTPMVVRATPARARNQAADEHFRTATGGTILEPPRREFTGWHPTCNHTAEPVPCTVLDPFSGAGTVGLVADRLGRNAVLVELKPEYVEMSVERVVSDAPLFVQVERS